MEAYEMAQAVNDSNLNDFSASADNDNTMHALNGAPINVNNVQENGDDLNASEVQRKKRRRGNQARANNRRGEDESMTAIGADSTVAAAYGTRNPD